MRSYRLILVSLVGAVALVALVVVLRPGPPSGEQTEVEAKAESGDGVSAPQTAPPPAVAPHPVAASPDGQEVGVRWGPGVDDTMRRTLETKYQLTQAKFDPGDPRRRTWLYRLMDVTPGNVKALLADPGLEDSAHIGRP